MSIELEVTRYEALAKVLGSKKYIEQTMNEMKATHQAKPKDPADAEQPRAVQDQVMCTHAMYTICTHTQT